MSSSLTRRDFIAATATLSTGAAAIGLQAQEPADTSFASIWDQHLDRVWLGPEYWANPMQDWHIEGGRVECVNAAPDRNVHVLTRQLGPQSGTLSISVKAGRVGGGALGMGKGSLGFRLGILGTLKDHPDLHDYRNNLWPSPGAGFDAGIATDGTLVLGQAIPALKIPLEAGTVELRLEAEPADGGYQVTLQILDGDTGTKLGEHTVEQVPAERLTGNVALVNNFGGAGKNAPKKPPNFGLGQFWFSEWKLSGTKLVVADEQTFGPILFSQYTLSRGVLKLTAQMAPLGEADSQGVRFEVEKDGQWVPLAEEPIHPQARTATFRFENWDASLDVPYRLGYTLRFSASSVETDWTGVIRRDPVDSEELVVGDVSCNIHTLFPNVPLVRNMAKLNPDLLAFVGDQFYENCGGYGTIRDPLEPAILDYLRKWYFHGWTWRELTRDRPSVSLPDDHDVYQGNLWGEAGAGRQTTQEAGGYDLPAEWVNVVHRTQTSHHPDPYDPTPCLRGTTNYYGPLTYGRVSFAVLADRQYKTGPDGQVPPTGGRADHETNPAFDPKTSDVPGLELLGAKQLQFLREWAADWRGADMKAVISATIFSAMATTHGGNHEILFADYDANGWPRGPRNAALREIRKAFAFHIAGDQHLTAVIHYGIEAHGDAGAAFAGPAVNVGYPRWWEPEKTGRNKVTGTAGVTGDFHDHFGHPLNVLAVNNPPYELPKDVVQQVNAKSSGLGVLRFHKGKRLVTVECWPYLADPAQPGTQMKGWPVEIPQMANYGRKSVAKLPKVSAADRPVLQVWDPKGELVYAFRLAGAEFEPHVFIAEPHTVKLCHPESGAVLKEWIGVVPGGPPLVA